MTVNGLYSTFSSNTETHIYNRFVVSTWQNKLGIEQPKEILGKKNVVPPNFKLMCTTVQINFDIKVTFIPYNFSVPFCIAFTQRKASLTLSFITKLKVVPSVNEITLLWKLSIKNMISKLIQNQL